MRWLSLLGVLLTGCAVYQVRPLPEIPERPASARRIFVVLAPHTPGESHGSAPGPWWEAVGIAQTLEEAGFRPWIVKDASEVPRDEPMVENFSYRSEPVRDPCPLSPLLGIPVFLTLGVVPGAICVQSGDLFDFRRTPESLPQRIDTRWDTQEVIGIFASLLTLSPSWSLDRDFPNAGRDHDRKLRALRAALFDALGD